KAGKVAELRVGDEHDVAPGPAVAPVGAALRDVLLAAEGERAVSPAPRLNVDRRTVVEHAASVAGGHPTPCRRLCERRARRDRRSHRSGTNRSPMRAKIDVRLAPWVGEAGLPSTRV